MRKATKSVRALVLSWVLLVGGPLLQSVSAQDGKRSEDGAPYLGASEVAFEWQYSCSGGKACSFTCPGSGGASNVTALTLQLGTIPLSGNQRAFGIFYKFSTVQIPRANGFSLTTGISTLSCQVNGMDLDYSGPRKSVDSSAPTASIPSQESSSRAQLRWGRPNHDLGTVRLSAKLPLLTLADTSRCAGSELPTADYRLAVTGLAGNGPQF